MTRAPTATPNPHRPRLPEELEQRLAPLDRRSAEVYTHLEDELAALDELDKDDDG